MAEEYHLLRSKIPFPVWDLGILVPLIPLRIVTCGHFCHCPTPDDSCPLFTYLPVHAFHTHS